MKEDRNSNPQYTNQNLDRNSESLSNDIDKENPNQNDKVENNVEKLLEDNPGAFLLRETSIDEEATSAPDKTPEDRSDLEEEITEEDETDDNEISD